jgi:hypothetical protein
VNCPNCDDTLECEYDYDRKDRKILLFICECGYEYVELVEDVDHEYEV